MAQKDSLKEDFLTCSICIEVFKEPKTLSCLHRFCEKCLHAYIIGQKISLLNRQGGFQCPVCREMMKIPDSKRPPSEWSSLLKTDFYLNNLIRFLEQKGDMEAASKKPKQPCSKHKENEADLFCVDCQQIICHLCAGINHRSCFQVVTVTEAAADKKAAMQIWLGRLNKIMTQRTSIDNARDKNLASLEKQKAKAEEQIKAWSEEWQKAIRKEEAALLLNMSKQYQSLSDRMSTKLVCYNDNFTKAKEKIQNVSANGNTLSDSDILKMSNLMESDMIKELEHDISMYKSYVDLMQKIEISYERYPKPEMQLGALVMKSQNEQTETSFTSPKTLEVSTPQQGTKVYDLDLPSSVLFSKDSSSGPFINLKGSGASPSSPSPSMTSRLKDRLSRVLPKKPPLPPPPAPHAKRRSETTQIIPEDDSDSSNSSRSSLLPSQDVNQPVRTPVAVRDINSNVREVRSIDASFREDSATPKLRDVVVAMPGNTILVTDWANQSVKAFFVRRDKDCRLTVGGKPWAITQLGPSSAAVSLPLARQICILKITSPLMVQKSFMVAKSYSGLATLNNETLVASGGSQPPSVDIINLFGEVLKSFSRDAHGNSLFIYPAYVSVTPSMQILVSDKKRGAVLCLSHTGKVEFEFCPQGNKELQEPCGITSTTSGHVLLVELRGVLKLTPRGEVERPLIRHNDGHVIVPKGVDIDLDGLIYVTTNEESVAVFEVL